MRSFFASSFAAASDAGLASCGFGSAPAWLIDGQFPVASVYVREKSPDVYGSDAEEAQQVDRGYELEMSSSNPYASIGDLLKDHDDPAYQARITERLEEDGILETHVEEFSVGHHYNGWNEAFLEALQAAEERRGISEDQLEQYSEGLE